MSILSKILTLSKQIAASLLKDHKPIDLYKSEIFNEENKDYIIKNLTDENIIRERLEQSNQIDKKADWKTVKSKIDAPVRKLFWRYAAVASVIGIITATYFFKDGLLNNSNNDSSVIVNTIKIGTDKAILTLDDGSQIALEKGTSFQTKNANSNGEQIVYGETNSEEKSKIVYNYLTIPRGGQFFIMLADGTQIWLNSESQLKYPVSFVEGETREVELVYGEAYFDVSPSSEHNGADFKVINNKQEVKVLGTEFNVKAYSDETNIYTTLVEGKVAISFEDKKQDLLPNQQSNINILNNALTVKTVEVYNEISWKDGVFSFEEKTLKEIMKVLTRWYDVDIVFKNSAIENEEFIGVLGKDQNIEEILINIKNFGIIKDYEIDDTKIVLE
ncbi:FecR family protein [Thalassobellus suaedae]|uniref:FecR family protein n=1 Tax=Thalassobellus suaedae TaxID=3074124 RepID=A0ABY9XZA3_9FLAO|nr:FecR family protein [Flavobacteriaceae bacterium HL-DH10]